MQNIKPRKFDIFLLLIIVLVSVIIEVLFFNYTTDDAFISFRYARNLAKGHGLVFNPGERVEGFTNFLWTMLMVPAFIFKVDILIWHKLLGIILSVLTLFVIFKLSLIFLGSLEKKMSPAFALLPVFVLSMLPPYAIYNINGMENPLFLFLLTLSAYLFASGAKYSLLTGLSLGLLSITRPEGTIFMLIALFVTGISKYGWNFFVKLLSGFTIIYFPFILFRAGYYGELFPNTYYAKLSVSPLLRFRTWGAKYITDLLRVLPYGIFIWATLLCIPLVFKKRSVLLYSFLGFWAILLYSAYIGGDPFPYFRIFSLGLPLGVICILGGIAYLHDNGRSRGIFNYIILGILIFWTLLSLNVCIKNFKELNSHYHFRPFHTRPLAAHWEDWAKLGERLKEILPENSSVVVQDVGAIPFYSNLVIIDPIGLVDSTLAHLFFREGYNDYYQGYLDFETCAKVHKLVRDYIFEQRKADAILYHLDSRRCDDMSISFHYHYLYLDPRFDKSYKKVEEFKDVNGECIYSLYLRKTTEAQTPMPQGQVPKRSKSYILY